MFAGQIFKTIAGIIGERADTIALFLEGRASFEEWFTWEAFAACRAEAWSVRPQVSYAEVGLAGPTRERTLALAALARDCGLDGVVCSPREIAPLRAEFGPDFLLVVPGVRPAGASLGDQKRVMTPGEALGAGADYLVVGRPISGAEDPAAAARAIAAELAGPGS